MLTNRHRRPARRRRARRAGTPCWHAVLARRSKGPGDPASGPP